MTRPTRCTSPPHMQPSQPNHVSSPCAGQVSLGPGGLLVIPLRTFGGPSFIVHVCGLAPFFFLIPAIFPLRSNGQVALPCHVFDHLWHRLLLPVPSRSKARKMPGHFPWKMGRGERKSGLRRLTKVSDSGTLRSRRRSTQPKLCRQHPQSRYCQTLCSQTIGADIANW